MSIGIYIKCSQSKQRPYWDSCIWKFNMRLQKSTFRFFCCISNNLSWLQLKKEQNMQYVNPCAVDSKWHFLVLIIKMFFVCVWQNATKRYYCNNKYFIFLKCQHCILMVFFKPNKIWPFKGTDVHFKTLQRKRIGSKCKKSCIHCTV